MELTLNQLINQGKKRFENKEFQEAYTELSQAIHLLEKNESELKEDPIQDEYIAEIHAMRGTSLMMLHESEALSDPDIFHQIVDDYDFAAQLMPNEPDYLYLRGQMHLYATFENFLEEAEGNFKDALKIDSEHSESQKGLGEVYLKKGKFSPSIDIFDRILREDDEDGDTHALKAMALIRKSPPNFSSAAFHLNKSLAINPNQEELYIWLSTCFQEMGEVREAIKAYDKLIDLNPFNANYLVDRGVLKSLIDREAAVEDYVQALELTPHPLAYNNRADYFRSKGQFDQALEDAFTVIEIDPESYIAYATLAEIYADMKEEDAFYQHLELALKHYYDDIVDAMSTPSFKPYIEEERFTALINKYKRSKDYG